jgi:hypothetical protein
MNDKDYENIYQANNQKERSLVSYKDSEEARFNKEVGDTQEDVTIKDVFTNGLKITFVWNRGKSNENVTDIGDGKKGFSFYQARYVYRDPYSQKNIAKVSNPGGLSVVGTVFEDDQEAMIVIQEKEEGKDEEGNRKIRIFSATYAPDILQLKYFKRAFEMAKKSGGKLPRLEESSSNDIFIARTTLRHRNFNSLTF